MLNGMKITVSENATEEFHIFPDRKRTKRGERRFRAKYGSDIRRRPCAFKTPFGLIVHPKIWAQLRVETCEAERGKP